MGTRRSAILPLFLAALGLVLCQASRARAESADTSRDFFAPGRMYPSAHQAPIKIPYIIFTYSEQGQGLPVTASGNSWSRTPNPSWWENLPYKLFLADREVNRANESGEYGGYSESNYYTYYNERLEQGYDGLGLNEYSWSNGNGATWQANTFNPLNQLQDEYPKAMIFAWIPHFRGTSNNVDQLAQHHESVDMIVSESYVNCDGTTDGWDIDLAAWYKRVADTYEKYGLEGKAMIGISLGSSTSCPRPSQADFDRMLSQIRTTLPYAPHIFFWHKWHRSEDSLRWDGYMASIKREIFDKSPTAAIVSLSDGKTVGGTVNLTASFTPNAETKKPVRQYRFFVDNTCVYVGDSATYRWNTNDESEGKHVITAHVVDETWLAGAAQIEVTVSHDATTTRGQGLSMRAGPFQAQSGVEVFDLAGRRVTTSAHGRGPRANLVPSGAYVVRFRAASGTERKAVVRVRPSGARPR